MACWYFIKLRAPDGKRTLAFYCAFTALLLCQKCVKKKTSFEKVCWPVTAFSYFTLNWCFRLCRLISNQMSHIKLLLNVTAESYRLWTQGVRVFYYNFYYYSQINSVFLHHKYGAGHFSKWRTETDCVLVCVIILEEHATSCKHPISLQTWKGTVHSADCSAAIRTPSYWENWPNKQVTGSKKLWRWRKESNVSETILEWLNYYMISFRNESCTNYTQKMQNKPPCMLNYIENTLETNDVTQVILLC